MTGATDRGRKRKNNQDSIYFNESEGLAIVADGIGGRQAGEIASSLAVNNIKTAFKAKKQLVHREIKSFLNQTIEQVNIEILTQSVMQPDLRGMGTTLNCLVFAGTKLFVGHAGDSRTYLFVDQQLFQITTDQTVENYMVRGKIHHKKIHALAKPDAIVSALGLSQKCQPEIYELDLKPGTIILSCSDGLTGMISDQEICRTIAQHRNQFYDLPQHLIRRANENGGKDNITIFLAEVAPIAA